MAAGQGWTSTHRNLLAAFAGLLGVAACGDSSTTPEDPSIALSSATVVLQAPAAREAQTAELAITNGGGGTLGSPTIDLTYAVAQAEDWLAVDIDDPAAPSALSFRATPLVRPGTYEATVTVSESNGDSEETLLATAGRPANTLLDIDLVTGAASVIGTHGVPDLFSLEMHPPTQSLYGWRSAVPRGLQRIDRSSAAATQVGDPFGSLSALAWDSSRDTMWGIGANSGPAGGFLVEVDLSDGSYVVIGSTLLPGLRTVAGIARVSRPSSTCPAAGPARDCFSGPANTGTRCGGGTYNRATLVPQL